MTITMFTFPVFVLSTIYPLGIMCFQRHYTFTVSRVNTSFNAVPLQLISTPSGVRCNSECLSNPMCAMFEYSDTARECKLFDVIPRSPPPENPDGSITVGIPEIPRDALRMTHSSISHSSVPWPTQTGDSVLTSMTFKKLCSNSSIRVTFYGAMGGWYCYGCAKSFHMLFNGTDCSSPQNAEKLSSLYALPQQQRFMPNILETECIGLGKGDMLIELVAGKVPGYPVSNSTIASTFDSHILVEEIVPQPDKYPNRKHYLRSGSSYSSKVVWSNQFFKKKNDSWLLISWITNLRVRGAAACLRHYVNINSNPCSDPAPLEGQFYRGAGGGLSSYHNGPIGGICKGVPAGNVLLEASWDSCRGLSVTPWKGNHLTSWFTEDNLFIEEVYPNTLPLPSVTSSFNLQSHHWTEQSILENGVITTFLFNKIFASSTIRLKFYGNLGLYLPPSSPTATVAWCFEIDGGACSNPGHMCQVFSTSASTEDHLPFELMGICQKVGRGIRSVAFTVRVLSGTPDVTTGWPAAAANSWIIADEIFLE